MMGSGGAPSQSDLSTLGAIATLMSDPKATQQLIADLQARTDAAKEAEASAAARIAEASEASKTLAEREAAVSERESAAAAAQQLLDAHNLELDAALQQLVSERANLSSDQTAFAKTQRDAEIASQTAARDAATRMDEANSALALRAHDLQAAEDSFAAREQALADAKAQFDAYVARITQALTPPAAA